LSVGYFNRNTEEFVETQIGSNNFIDTGGLDQGRSTVFKLPRQCRQSPRLLCQPSLRNVGQVITRDANGRRAGPRRLPDRVSGIKRKSEQAQSNLTPMREILLAAENEIIVVSPFFATPDTTRIGNSIACASLEARKPVAASCCRGRRSR
jgi:hypothetical protein